MLFYFGCLMRQRATAFAVCFSAAAAAVGDGRGVTKKKQQTTRDPWRRRFGFGWALMIVGFARHVHHALDRRLGGLCRLDAPVHRSVWGPGR
jgi:hypothetical protein